MQLACFIQRAVRFAHGDEIASERRLGIDRLAFKKRDSIRFRDSSSPDRSTDEWPIQFRASSTSATDATTRHRAHRHRRRRPLRFEALSEARVVNAPNDTCSP